MSTAPPVNAALHLHLESLYARANDLREALEDLCDQIDTAAKLVEPKA